MWKVARKVSLEPIPGGLLSGVPLRKLVAIGDKLSVKFPGPKNLCLWIPDETIKEFCKEEDGFVFSMVSSVKYYQNCQVETLIWKPFLVSNCKAEPISSSCSISDKFARITQKFKIIGKSSGMFQFMCMNWKVKFNDQYYTRNDILTVNYGKICPDPWPSHQNIIPEELQTFVPVSGGTKVNVLINKERQTIDSPCPGSKIKLIGETFFDYSFQHLGSPLSVYRYGISQQLETSDSLFLTNKKWHNEVDIRSIIFTPFRETAGFRYFVVKEPYSKAAVLTQGCNAVKLVTRTKFPIKVSDNCPASISFISRIGDLTFYMIVLHSVCPLIYIEKTAEGWEVKCPI